MLEVIIVTLYFTLTVAVSVSNTLWSGAKRHPPMTKINMSQNRFSNQVIYDQGYAPVGELRDIKKAELHEFKKEFQTF